MDIRTLRHFVAVVQEEGISAAADVLRMSQPALSRQMKELENELGVTLFERGNRGRSISLTKEGRVFYRRARQIIELADRARAEVHMHDEIAGTIHITAAESNLMNIVALAIALELDMSATQDLLARAGFTLSKSSKFDVIVRFFLERGVHDVFRINEALFAFDQSLLGA